MEHESFEDNEIATLLNSHYISIKVDREERPDIDSVYMSVCQAMNGQGGWPLTILMTPDQQPFFSATYLPKRSRNGHSGLMELLLRVTDLWKRDNETLIKFSTDIMKHISDFKEVTAKEPNHLLIEDGVSQFKNSFDPVNGGFGGAPKFPTPHNLLFLLRYGAISCDEECINMVDTTLTQMYKGGIFDHVGGGFSRYSTDSYWLVPHFEKMLYDNALLLYTYTEYYEYTKDPLFKKIAERISSYVLSELTDPLGGFYCAQDADSEGVEGKYYVFTPTEVKQILGNEAGELFNKQFDITDNGNFEGKNIPNLLKNPRPFLYALDDSLQLLYDYRKNRTQLHKDDKILTSWNSLMISALAKAARVFQDDNQQKAAKKAYHFIHEYLMNENYTLKVRYRDSHSAGEGKIDDYAFLSLAAFELYKSTYDLNYLEDCIKISKILIVNFFDEEQGGCYLYSKEGEQLIKRPKEVYDGAIPSGNSVFAFVLIQLYRLTGDIQWKDYIEKQLAFLSGHIQDYPAGYSFSLIAIQSYLNSSKELICTAKTQDILLPLQELLLETYQPDLSLLIKTEENQEQLEKLAPFTEDYPIPEEGALYYLCENNACSAPIKELKELNKLLSISKK